MSSKPPNPTARGGHFTETLLLKAHPPEIASQIFTDKIKSHVLNLNPTQPSDVADGRAQRRRQREEKKALRRKSRKPKPLTARDKRKSRIYEIPRECQRYEIYEPLHRLWVGYVQDVLFGEAGMLPRISGDGHAEKGKALMVGQDLAAKLMSADLHGSHMKVVRSRCPSRVGIKGIMVKETKMTFEIITKGNVLKSEQRSLYVDEFTLIVYIQRCLRNTLYLKSRYLQEFQMKGRPWGRSKSPGRSRIWFFRSMGQILCTGQPTEGTRNSRQSPHGISDLIALQMS